MGSRRYPFRQFVLKIHSRCNLACHYCYVYTKADQRWRTRPKIMDVRVVEQAAMRMVEHATRHGSDSFDVILHGGEPLLAGPERISHCAAAMRSAAAGTGIDVGLRVQTNGTLLDGRMLRLLGELGFRIGVSIDGDHAGQDRHRRRADGSGSHADVRRALLELGEPRNRQMFSGLLCTVDLQNDPVVTYEALLEFQPPAVDFLLPHGNWSSPSPERVASSADTPYADWLIAVFERWYSAPRLETRVRMFDQIMRLLLGGRSTVEGLGLAPTTVIVVETDGAIEQSDILSSAYDGAAATGLDVSRNAFDEALDLPEIVARQSGLVALAPECRRCRLVRVCGGGFYPHRYRVGSGFMNPSMYCPDLIRLIDHCRDRLGRDVDTLRASGGRTA